MNSVFRVLAALLACALVSCAHVPAMQPKPMLGKNTWRSYDGKEMPWRPHDVPAGTPLRAVLITLHGLSGAASDFWMLDESLPRRGMAVYGVELRGMGNDPDKGRRGDIRSFGIWERDLFTFQSLVRARHPGVPIYWHGESLGSLIALHTQSDLMTSSKQARELRPAGLIFSSPLAGLKTKPSLLRRVVIRAAMILLPERLVNLEKLVGVRDEDIRVTVGTTHEAQMTVTPHHVPEFTLRLLWQIDGKMSRIPSALRHVDQPLLVLATPNDVISSRAQLQEFFDSVPSEAKTLHWYEKSYHLILHDVQRDEALRDVTGWLEAQVAGKRLASGVRP